MNAAQTKDLKRAPKLSQADAIAFANHIKADEVFRKAVNATLAAKPSEPKAGSEPCEMVRAYAKREGWEQAIRYLLSLDRYQPTELSLDEFQVMTEPDFVKD